MPRAALLAVFFLAAPVQAGPRDELLRVAPPDAALLVVVQNARDHVRNLTESPFGQWLPTTDIGRHLLSDAAVKQFRESVTGILTGLDTTPRVVIEDVLGDAVAFAYSPAAPDRPNDERAVILIRPGKPETLTKLVGTLNDLQTKNGELKAVVRREHSGGEYFERQKTEGGGEFYCLRGGVFAFSSSEADIKAVIERDTAGVPGKEPALVTRLKQLRVEDAAAFVLVNPRPLDAEVKARVAAAKPDEQRFLAKFAEVWTGLESAAIYCTLDKELEIGVSLRFHPEKLPATAKPWLLGPHAANTAATLIPNDALFGFAGHTRAAELIEMVASLAPVPAGKPGVKEWVAEKLGPVVGRNNLPLVLDSLGPNWAVWAEPPAKDSFLPTFVAAVEIGGDGESRARAERSLVQAIEFGFTMGRVAYNSRHADQIELKEEKDAATGAVIKSLVNEKGFPPGFRPSFALTRGHLVLATSPDAIRRFVPSKPDPQRRDTATLAKFSGTASRDYLRTHGPKLAKFLADLGAGDEKQLRGLLDSIAAVLELVDSAELTRRDIENGLKLSVRIKTAKPLKK